MGGVTLHDASDAALSAQLSEMCGEPLSVVTTTFDGGAALGVAALAGDGTRHAVGVRGDRAAAEALDAIRRWFAARRERVAA